MDVPRSLVVVADDLGIGPATSHGILHLAGLGKVTGTVLLVNSPYADHAVHAWRKAGGPALIDLGWHPCLTLDRPVLLPRRVPSLVAEDGCFLPLARFIARLMVGRVRLEEVRAELQAQYDRFVAMTRRSPALVNGHHHIQVLPGIGRVLLDVLARQRPLPYVRRMRETIPLLAAIPRARWKRALLATLGGRFIQQQRDFPGNDYLAGISDPRGLTRMRRGKEENLLVRWLAQVPGRVVEFVCHPGGPDETLAGRDSLGDARVRELELLEQTDLAAVCRSAGFRLSAPSQLNGHDERLAA
ncbi:MAG: ChbG/HpnK family deacetylase [Planctomycetes bacterium]|nr:ChbG/HpnK family deacetylase [Planctomycetota bacterium]